MGVVQIFFNCVVKNKSPYLLDCIFDTVNMLYLDFILLCMVAILVSFVMNLISIYELCTII